MPRRTKNNFASYLSQSSTSRSAPVLRFPGAERDYYNSSSNVEVRLNQASNNDFLDEEWNEEGSFTKIRLVDDARFVSQNDSSLTDEADLSELEQLMENPAELKAFIRENGLATPVRTIFDEFKTRMPDNKIALKLYQDDSREKVGFFVLIRPNADIAMQAEQFDAVSAELFVDSEAFDGLPVFSILDFAGVV